MMVQSMLPMHPFEDYLRVEKMKYFKPELGDQILDIGGGDGGIWLLHDYDIDNPPFYITLVEPDETLRQKAEETGVYQDTYSWLHDVYNLQRFDKIVIAGVLEHLDNPCNDILFSLDGCSYIYITVPNALSYHRYLGVELDIIGDETELGPQDLAIGHKRVYTPEGLKRVIDRFIEFSKTKYSVEYHTTTFKFDTSDGMMNHVKKFHAMNAAAERVGIIGDGMHGAEIVAILRAKNV